MPHLAIRRELGGGGQRQELGGGARLLQKKHWSNYSQQRVTFDQLNKKHWTSVLPQICFVSFYLEFAA